MAQANIALSTDHPRGCGAHFAPEIDDLIISGSSPRVRGTPHPDSVSKFNRRIIPAGAGHTVACAKKKPRRADHPRGCGAHRQINRQSFWKFGSSPRVRGTPAFRLVPTGIKRIIPAGAGHTMAHRVAQLGDADHPRGCGAHVRRRRSWRRWGGSSPRVRGTPVGTVSVAVTARIIPAGAGHTQSCRAFRSALPDHPRGCGAHSGEDGGMTTLSGSSPRVRGTRTFCSVPPECQRIIPAGAGHTAMSSSNPPNLSDHPRGCGAHRTADASTARVIGSSPRVRGTPVADKLDAPQVRIIPAGAGHTTIPEFRTFSRADHPRGCGAHLTCRKVSHWRCGSSPRVRGTLRRLRHARHYGRIIPAGAGHTGCDRPKARSSADHPRGCGAHSIVQLMRRDRYGSSPRVRGTPNIADAEGRGVRIIPAGAGHTPRAARHCPPGPDHPRGCGAHELITPAGDTFRGSSPRVRGTRRPLDGGANATRIIPAGAGHTVPQIRCRQSRSDHPRGCGAHGLPARGNSSTSGSSPRVRGTRGSAPPVPSLERIIPAGAGHT